MKESTNIAIGITILMCMLYLVQLPITTSVKRPIGYSFVVVKIEVKGNYHKYTLRNDLSELKEINSLFNYKHRYKLFDIPNKYQMGDTLTLIKNSNYE